jgi:diguanylate cyclase (GGDEF)-like protein
MVLTASVIWCAWFGSYVASLKETLRQSNTELREAVSSASRMATRDHLTQSFNRRYMMECLSREKDRADKSGSIFAVCIFDLDHFKALNDRYGHLVGDEVLSAFAYLARQELRATDVIDLDSEGRCFGRFGGEEFMCLLPSTSEAGATKCAERLRQATEEKVFRGGVRVTLSAGVAEYAAGESVADTLRRADEALYFAKQSGRNRVESAKDDSLEDKESPEDVVIKGNFSGGRKSR